MGDRTGTAMTAEDGESYEVLVEQRLGRQGLEVKLDRGFEDSVYCVYVEFDGQAGRVGSPPPTGKPKSFAPC